MSSVFVATQCDGCFDGLHGLVRFINRTLRAIFACTPLPEDVGRLAAASERDALRASRLSRVLGRILGFRGLLLCPGFESQLPETYIQRRGSMHRMQGPRTINPKRRAEDAL